MLCYQSKTMEPRRVYMLKKLYIDVAMLVIVALPILFLYLFGKPYQRGFFCNDESLKHPFKNSTVANYWLYIIGLGLPVVTMSGTEFWLWYRRYRNDPPPSKLNLEWMWSAYCVIIVFGFGAASSQLVTDVAKYGIGRLRPHFFDVCNPKIDCSLPENQHIYFDNFTCNNEDSRLVKEVRLSFPSGHSSFSFYTMVYLALYLQSRMTWRGSALLRPLLQLTAIIMAWGTALSRISDYKHHWSDALAGSLIGIIAAILTARHVSSLFCPQRDLIKISTPTNMDAEIGVTSNSSNGASRNL